MSNEFQHPLWFISFLLLDLTRLGLLSFHLFQCHSNFINPDASAGTPADILWSHSFSSFISFSMYSFHEFWIPFSSTITLPNTPFRQSDPIISCCSFSNSFAIRKISFWWLGSFKSLAHYFCLFPFAKEITHFAFSILFLYSFHASVNFSFFPISILFLLFPYCFSNFLIPPRCFLMTAWTFWQCTCDLCCFRHYIFHRLSVFIYSTLLPLPCLWPCFGILHMSFPPSASIHALWVQMSSAIFLLYIKPHVHYYTHIHCSKSQIATYQLSVLTFS